MADVVFAFGPNDSYFWQSQTQWERRGLPAALEAKFKASYGARQIQHVFEMALGTNGSYYVGWRAKDGKIYSSNYGLPADLAAWLAKNNSGDTVRVSLGPNNASYWATDLSGTAYCWRGLPDAVSSVLQTMPPKFISLGFNGAYVIVGKSGGARWGVSGNYAELDKHLQGVKSGGTGAFKTVNYISLGAHAPTVDNGSDKFYVMTFANGSYHGAVPKGTQAAAAKVLETARIPTATPPAVTQQRSNTHPAGAQQRSDTQPAVAQQRSNTEPAVAQQRSDTQPAAAQQRSINVSNNIRHNVSNNAGDFLKLANNGLNLLNTGLNLVNALAGGGSYQPTNNYSSPSFDTSAFQASLQQQTWDTTSSAAADPVQ